LHLRNLFQSPIPRFPEVGPLRERSDLSTLECSIITVKLMGD